MTTVISNKKIGRTTVTMKAEGLAELMKMKGFKSKSKAAQFAVEEALRMAALEVAASHRGTIEFDEESMGCHRFGH